MLKAVSSLALIVTLLWSPLGLAADPPKKSPSRLRFEELVKKYPPGEAVSDDLVRDLADFNNAFPKAREPMHLYAFHLQMLGIKRKVPEFRKVLGAALKSCESHPESPGGPQVVMIYANLVERSGHRDSAEKLYREAIALYTPHPELVEGAELYFRLARILAYSNRIAEERALLEKGQKVYRGSMYEKEFGYSLKSLEILGKPADVAGPLLEGGDFDVKQMKGKVVLIDFWATWCGICLDLMPELRKLHSTYGKQGFEIIGVNMDHGAEAAREYLRQNSLPWKNIFFETAEQYRKYKRTPQMVYGVHAIPFSLLVGKDGSIKAVNVRDAKALEKAIQDALAEK